MANVIDFGNKSKVFDEIKNSNKKDKYKIIEMPYLYIDCEKGKVLDTFRNLEFLLSKFNADIKYNLMTRQREISVPNHQVFSDDAENSCYFFVHFLATINMMPTKLLDNHLDFLAFNNPYHPIINCLKSKEWDGVLRLDKFIKTLETDEKYYPIIKTWMVAAVAAAFSENGFINQGALVLQGKQNIGKTKWVKSLDPANCRAVKEGAILDPNNKDNVFLFAKHWIVEIGELDATFRKADVARLKSFITMEADDVRLPYAKRSSRLPRRSAYVATVNDDHFLVDETGNRRWWTIPVKSIDLEHGLDMQQVWAEVLNLLTKGHLTYLDSSLQNSIDESNKSFEKTDPYQELIVNHYNWNTNQSTWRWMSTTEIMKELNLKYDSRSDSIRFGKILSDNVTKSPILEDDKHTRIRKGFKQYKVPLFVYKSDAQ